MLANVTHNTLKSNTLAITEAVELVKTWFDLTDLRRRDLISALSRAADLMGLPPDAAGLTPALLRGSIFNKPAMAFGLTEGSMRNIRSALRAVMVRAGITDSTGTPLTPAWVDLLDRLPTKKRAGLVTFARYCCAKGIPPAGVDDDALVAFRRWLEDLTLSTRPAKLAGATRGHWNRCTKEIAGWPAAPLAVLKKPGAYILPLDAFPASFQAEVHAFGRRLGANILDDPFDAVEGNLAGSCRAAAPLKPCRPSTIETRLGHLRWAASAAVASGTPIAEITGLASLVTPLERVQQVLRFLYRRAGDKPSANGGHVAEALRMIAKHHAGLSDDEVGKIRKWAKTVTLVYKGMTKKNAATMRLMMCPETEAKFLLLPASLMEAARRLQGEAPREASRLAMRASAIGLLTSAPIRSKNLTGLRLDEHLMRDNARGPITRIWVPIEETKNCNLLDLPVSPRTAALLEEWIRDFRPALAQPGSQFLFPGAKTASKPMTRQAMREAIVSTIRREIGVSLTTHQFRQLDALMYLRDYPGHYEDVRQLLGHKDIGTTINAYCGVESENAVQRFHDILEAKHKVMAPPSKKRGLPSNAVTKSGKGGSHKGANKGKR